jgi:hypothetical protein
VESSITQARGEEVSSKLFWKLEHLAYFQVTCARLGHAAPKSCLVEIVGGGQKLHHGVVLGSMK